MKRLLLFSILMCFIFSIFAQTTVETALPFKEGVNSFTFESSTGQNIVYYAYTAPAEQGKLLSIEIPSPSMNVMVSLDGTYYTNIAGIIDSKLSIFPVKKGQKVYLSVSIYNQNAVNFTTALKDANVEGGETCATALIGTEANFFVPTYFDIKTYQYNPTFISYNCTEDGLLEMEFGGYLSFLNIHEGCDGTSEKLTATSSGYKYVAKYGVKAGKNYIIEAGTSSPMMAGFKLTHPKEGASCDMPFVSKEKDNILPGKAGKYWYKCMPDKRGFMLITSENGLPGGNISVYTSCSDYAPLFSINGYFAVRCKVDANVSYLICIEKAEDTNVDENFDITIEDSKAGDSFDSPLSIETGNYTVPQYDGTYYYKITVPEGNSRFLVIDAKSANLQNTNSSVQLFSSNNSYSPIAQAKNYIKSEVSGNESYLVVWHCNEGFNSFAFKTSFEEIIQGDVCSNPLLAILEKNPLPVGAIKYYHYKATKNGWLLIDTDITVGVSFPRDCQYGGEYDAVKMGTLTKMEVIAGADYLIKFSNISEATQFTLSEEEYKIGESCGTAIPLETTETKLPETVLNTWYKYIATQDGMVTVTSDIVFEQSSDYRRRSTVLVKAGDCSSYPVEIIKTNSEGSWYDGQFVVEAGDVLYINVVTVSVQAEKILTVTIRNLQPGEACSLPRLLPSGEVTLPEATRSNPVWYSIDLQPGAFNIISGDSYSMYLYKACGETNPLAQTNYSYDYITGKTEYKLNYTVTESGKYILKLDMSYNNTAITVSGSAIETGIRDHELSNVQVVGNAIKVTPNVTRTMIEIYNFTGQIIISQPIEATASFVVPKGIYIVRVGGLTQKVIVQD